MKTTASRPSFPRRIKLALWFAVDALVSLVPVARHPNRVLIVRLDRIGDLLLWLHAAQGIAAFYREQGKEVILLANDLWADWATELKIFDRVVSLVVSRFETNLRYRFIAGLAIRRLGCGIAVSPAYSRSWGAGDAIVHRCGASERIGFQGDPRNGTEIERSSGNRWYTRLISAAPERLMEIERNAEFVTGLTGARFPARVANLRGMGIDLSIAELTSEFAGNATYYVLFPGASSPGKCWPVERFQEIALRIYRETGWTGVVCGGPADVALARQLRAQAELPLIDRTGRTSLSQLTAILANARLVVANDTSAVHIAAALSVPAICVLGGGHVGRFLPYTTGVSSSAQLPIAVDHPMDCFDCNWECIHAVPAGAPKPCVAGVGVEDIWLKVSDIVANRRSC